MSQNDFNLANQGFPSMRADMNSAFQALATNSSGATAPATTYSYQWWYDTDDDILKQRNAGNDAWISVASYNQTTDQWFPFVGATALTATGAELNVLDGITATTAELNVLDGITATTAELNVLDGVTGLIGWGQTWQDVTASRAYATSYQNTTGRPISVSVQTGNNSFSPTSYLFEVSTNNSTWVTIGQGSTSGDDNFGFRGAFIVPNNIYYKVTRSGASTASITAWVELR